MQDGNKTKDWLELEKDDFQFVADAGGFETQVVYKDEADIDAMFDERVDEAPDTKALLKAISGIIISDGPDAFVRYVAEHKEEIRMAALFDEDIVRALLVGYKLGIIQKNGTCANDLGAMYYLGDMVEQDYEKAAELYELAIQWGCKQSIINMGYIYEYGRIGQPDYAKAYEYYALAAALTQMSEALYKLGDMYSRGKSVEKNLARAVQLWNCSLEKADDPREVAQPAIRLAPLVLEGSQEGNVEKNPMAALYLYQQAEVGLRLDINDGLDCYKKRLAQAIEGQQKARQALDEQEMPQIADLIFR